ncbi:alpha-ketoglutarate-dependent dioxygenase AlkB family protein [Niveispirillum fermenti]|uniref:alpha-ketoglutarate-dependent dioxygenase AlkB family protein n=1 Tax=Niveispirillum fermenti TaxID=1233113 RepID=UPI003A8836ED
MNRVTDDGFRFLPGHLDRAAQEALVAVVARIAEEAPFTRFVMPRTGRPFSIDMTNAGSLGWIADRQSYRYSPVQPANGRPWPAIPEPLLRLWRDLSGYAHDAECCLINHYRGEGARLSLHRDEDEEDFDAPIVNISLGDTGIFRLGGPARRDPTRSFAVESGTAMVFAGPSRMFYHGVDRLRVGSSRLLPEGGRLNLTLRRVTRG